MTHLRSLPPFVSTVLVLTIVGACSSPAHKRVSTCGDGVVSGNESCDAGARNGHACTPVTSCTYCTSKCTTKTLTNTAPTVNAGPDIKTSSLSVRLQGSASDDGFPHALTTSWTEQSGPASVSFSSDAPTATATFGATGVYSLELSASDGHYRTSDTVSVTIDALPTITFTPGVKLFSVSQCTGVLGGVTVIADTAHPVGSSPDGKDAFVVYPDANEDEYLTKVSQDGSCTPAIKVNQHVGTMDTHNHPSVFVTKTGRAIVDYHGGDIYGETQWQLNGPYTRTLLPDGSLTAEGRQRLWTDSETYGFRMLDGSVLLAGFDNPARIDIIEPDGSYRWPDARGVIYNSYDYPGLCNANRFTKAVFAQGADGNLYTIWGWAGPKDPTGVQTQCPDERFYTEDSHEVFFAMSEDGGVTWHDLADTKTVQSKLCPTFAACDGQGGIAFNDPAFEITSTRQAESRKIYVDENGNAYVAFVKSFWCDSGTCTTQSVTDPGALMMLTFDVHSGAVTQTMVDSTPTGAIGGIRPADSGIYIWTITMAGDAIEYFIDGSGQTTKTKMFNKPAGRIAGDFNIPHQNVARMLVSFIVQGGRQLELYQRAFSK